jgi:putative ABC transport system substrate-binding protein
MRFDVKRREFIGLLGGAAIACPATSFAQSRERTRRIGVVMAYAEDDPNGQIQIDAFRERLRTLGWSEGGNITIDVRYAKDNMARIREVAADLLRHTPDLIVSNSNLVTTVLQTQSTRSR